MDFTRTLATRGKQWETMTPEQQAMSRLIQRRAEQLRDEAARDGDSLGIRQAVTLASIQLGLDGPADD